MRRSRMVKLGMPGYKKLAKNCLNLVSNILNDMNISWFIGRGTLLGVVRENDFMNHDTDIDIEIFDIDGATLKEFITRLSKKIPFDIIKKYDDYLYLIGFRINRMRIDFDVWYRCDDKMYSIDESKSYIKEGYSFYEMPSKLFEIKTIEFKGIKVNIPKYAEEFLNLYIGKDWRIPKTHDEYITKRDSPSRISKEECPLTNKENV